MNTAKRSALLLSLLLVQFGGAMAADNLRLLGPHNFRAQDFAGRRIVLVAASFDGRHSYSEYRRAFEEAKRQSGVNDSAEGQTDRRNHNDDLNGRLALFGWYDADDDDVFYWFGVQIIGNGHSSRFIDCRRNERTSGGFYGSGFAPGGCRTDVAGGRIFCQFADRDNSQNHAVTWRINVSPPPSKGDILELSSPIDDLAAEIATLRTIVDRQQQDIDAIRNSSRE